MAGPRGTEWGTPTLSTWTQHTVHPRVIERPNRCAPPLRSNRVPPHEGGSNPSFQVNSAMWWAAPLMCPSFFCTRLSGRFSLFPHDRNLHVLLFYYVPRLGVPLLSLGLVLTVSSRNH